MQLDGLDIAIAVIAAVSVGFSKTGIPSSGIFTVTLMAMVFPAKESIGIVLPMLIIGDIIAVIHFRHKVVWKTLIVLLPWVLAGVVSGYYFLSLADDELLKMTIGWLVLGLILVHLIRERMSKTKDWPAWILSWFNPLLGILAGFATMIGNAAGGIMSIYLLAKKLPKEWFVGTAAWFFFHRQFAESAFFRSSGHHSWRYIAIQRLDDCADRGRCLARYSRVEQAV